MKPDEFLELAYKKNKWEDNIFAPPTSDTEGLNILIRHFLGDSWYSMNPIHHEQINTEAIYEILRKYPNAEQEKERRRKKIVDFFHNIIDRIFNQNKR